MNRLHWILLGFALLLIAACGGGGGGGGGTGGGSFAVTGRVLWIETGAAPTPTATVRIGAASTTTNAADGSFSLDAPSGAAEVSISYTPAGGSAVVRVYEIAPVAASGDLGDFYIGPQEVTVRGRILDSTSGAPLASANVSLAGRFAVSGADGVFQLAGVPYSAASQAVFFGLQGSVARTGYFSQFFSPNSPALGGVSDVGDIAIVPTGSTTPPPPPFNISGSITPSATGAGATVELLSGATAIRTTTGDASGRFRFWAPAGSYTVRATQGAQTATAPVTVVNPNTPVTVNVAFP